MNRDFDDSSDPAGTAFVDPCEEYAGNTVLISSTAVQHGFGRYPYKWVSHLTPEERAHVKAGGYVVFRSRPAGGNRGTTWRMAYSIRGGKLVPRVPPPSVLATLER